MFISTTPELLRALRIAVEHRFNGNQNIKITVIDVKKAIDSHHDITDAGNIARQLERPDATLLKSEWVFLGRIRACAIIRQVDFDEELYGSLTYYFPTFKLNCKLAHLRLAIPKDFGAVDQYLFNQDNKAEGDGRRCALLANCLGPWAHSLKLDVYLLLINQIKSWRQESIHLPRTCRISGGFRIIRPYCMSFRREGRSTEQTLTDLLVKLAAFLRGCG